jgi:hypothetical protein
VSKANEYDAKSTRGTQKQEWKRSGRENFLEIVEEWLFGHSPSTFLATTPEGRSLCDTGIWFLQYFWGYL